MQNWKKSLKPSRQRNRNKLSSLNLEDLVDLKAAEKPSNIGPEAKTKTRSKRKKAGWAAFPYNRLFELAQVSRDPLLAALAELHRLQFDPGKRTNPLSLPIRCFVNSALTIMLRLERLKHSKRRDGSALNGEGTSRR
jgi:hypothetical protein